MGHLPGFGVLGAVFMALRLLQIVSLVSVIGLTGSLVKDMVEEEACIATAYTLTSSILFSQHLLPLLIATAADATFLIAFIIAGCIIGKPVHNLTCKTFPNHGNAGTFISSLFTTTPASSSSSSSFNIITIDPSKSACHTIKATWGICIASTILFFASAAIAISLWNTLKHRRADRPRKTIDCE
ncbi:SSCRP protein [Trichoderma parareesei]|uniref:SSCRP protein n=1 Tax=Trichoderma parareesei TaxID=858221 RepID=A0A2H2ZRS1_TRIPA|nr:SSCRP protein [Trichoderma parareesei]